MLTPGRECPPQRRHKQLSKQVSWGVDVSQPVNYLILAKYIQELKNYMAWIKAILEPHNIMYCLYLMSKL